CAPPGDLQLDGPSVGIDRVDRRAVSGRAVALRRIAVLDAGRIERGDDVSRIVGRHGEAEVVVLRLAGSRLGGRPHVGIDHVHESRARSQLIEADRLDRALDRTAQRVPVEAEDALELLRPQHDVVEPEDRDVTHGGAIARRSGRRKRHSRARVETPAPDIASRGRWGVRFGGAGALTKKWASADDSLDIASRGSWATASVAGPR